MTVKPFRAREGFDAADHRLVNLADPALNAAGDAYEPTDGVNVRSMRNMAACRVVPDEAARLALSMPSLQNGDLVIQQDTGWTYRFSSPAVTRRPPAVQLRYGPTTPSASNPLNPIRFEFSGLPATEETTFRNYSTLLDTATGQTSTAQFEFTLQPGDGIHEALIAIQGALPAARNLVEDPPNAVVDTLPPNLRVLDAFLTSWSPPNAATPIGPHNWNIFSDFITLPSLADARGLEAAGEVREGMTVNVPSEDRIYTYQRGAWLEIFTGNSRTNILGDLLYDPEQPAHDRLVWADARTRMAVVDDVNDLSSPAIFPVSHLAVGKLVYVKSTGLLYELVVDPSAGQLTRTPADWKPMAGGATFVGKVGNLPNPAVDRIANGQLFIVTMDFAGEELDRLIVWDDKLPVGAPAPLAAVAITIAPTTGNPLTQDVTFDLAGLVTRYKRQVTWTIEAGGQTYTDTIDMPVGSSDTDFAQALGRALLGGSVPGLVPAVAGSIVTIDVAGLTRVDVTVDSPPLPPAVGGWRFLNRHIWQKGDRALQDQNTDQQDGDFQVTTESGHPELKVFDAAVGDWILLFSADEIKGWIAALNLFEGTVVEVGHAVPGAVDFESLPDLSDTRPSATTENAKLAAHYYTFVGSPGYIIKAAGATNDGIATLAGIPATLNPVPAAGLPYDDIINIRPRGGGTHGTGGKAHVQIDAAGAITVTVVEPGMGWTVGDLIHLTTKPDPSTGARLFDIDGTVGTLGLSGGEPNGLGADIPGAMLNPGDWLQVVNRGTAAAPDMHWVTVGGDLLAKSRADLLYGLKPWQDGSWESGAVVAYKGGLFRASRGVVTGDAPPIPAPATVSQVLSGTTLQALTGNPTQGLTAAPTAGDVEVTQGSSFIVAGGPFGGRRYVAGEHFVYLDPATHPELAGQGTTDEGFDFDQGWVATGLMTPPDPFVIHVTTGTTPWQKVDISGGVKHADTDAQLPNVAPPGEVWIVLDSAKAGGGQALYSYDMASASWKELGGGGKPLDLSGGMIVYPTAYYHHVQDVEPVATDPAPRITGDTLWHTDGQGFALQVAVSPDGYNWMAINRDIGMISAFAYAGAVHGWLLCDGSAIPHDPIYNTLRRVIGANVPDLRGQFIRGGTPLQSWPKVEWSTGLPKVSFGGTTFNNGGHSHHLHTRRETSVTSSNSAGSYTSGNTWAVGFNDNNPFNSGETDPNGVHSHGFEVTRGGDTETAPDHVVLAYHIKAY